MIPLIHVVTLLFGHWVGDFVFQRHKDASNKATSNLALTSHVLTYTLALLVFAAPVVGLRWAPAYALLNGMAHWVIDWFTSRLNKYLWAEGRIHDFFVSVGFDQWLHYAVLFGTYALILQRT